jgi:hypothetical protein
MYEGFRCKVLHEGELTKNFMIRTGVRQSCSLSPIIFLLVLDRIMRKTLGGRKRGIQWNTTERLEGEVETIARRGTVGWVEY